MIRLQNFIGGEFAAPISGQYFASPNPATEETNVEVPRSDARDIERAVQAAEAAFPAWSAMRIEHRADILDKIADAIDARAEDLARAESLDQGKTFAIARSMDI